MRKIIAYLAIISLLASCTEDKMPTLVELDMELRSLVDQASPTGSRDFYILPSEFDLATIPQDPKNPLTPVKVELGKMLYYETGIAVDAKKPSGMGTFSCSSCHIAEAGFKPGNFQGVADGGIGFGIKGEGRIRNTEYKENELDVQSARPLTMVNVAYVPNTMWNGSFGATDVNVGTEDVWKNDVGTARNSRGMQGIETQNIEGVTTHRMNINKEILDNLGYTQMFDEAFPEYPVEERYTKETLAFALSAYIRTIIANKAPFQNWLKGDLSALDYGSKKGAILFFGKANCAKCHYKENLGSLEFQAIGVKDMYQSPSYNAFATDKRNLGRGGFTLKEEDNYKFKVPGLYNVGDTEFFFHGASKTSLESVIEYKNLAQSENPNVPQERISEKLIPLHLTDKEKQHLVEFLKVGLRDPDLVRYKPSHILSGNCFPNNDFQSAMDMGCK